MPLFRRKITAALAAACLWAPFCPTQAWGADADSGMPPSVTVLASSSLTNVVTELVRLYSVQGTITVSATYDAPGDLAGAIEAGEPADLFISEHGGRMQDLKRQGLLDVFSLSPLVGNRLVLAISSDNPLIGRINRDQPLAGLLHDVSERTLLVAPDPDAVPAGMRARQALEKLGVWERLAPYVIRAGSARAAEYLVTKGKTAGILYYTDAAHNQEVEILAEFPIDTHEAVIYQAAVVAGENMPKAREFLAFLKSDRARRVFRAHGFSVM